VLCMSSKPMRTGVISDGITERIITLLFPPTVLRSASEWPLYFGGRAGHSEQFCGEFETCAIVEHNDQCTMVPLRAGFSNWPWRCGMVGYGILPIPFAPSMTGIVRGLKHPETATRRTVGGRHKRNFTCIGSCQLTLWDT